MLHYREGGGYKMVNGKRTSRRSVVVCALDCKLEGLGFKSHPSHAGFFSRGWFLSRAGSTMGPVGRLELHI